MSISIDKLLKMLEEPFTYKDSAFHRIFAFFCELILIIKYFYINIPFFIKLLAGLPVLYFGTFVYFWYAAFVIWTKIRDMFFRYNFSDKDFSIRKYLKTNLMRQLLFIILGLFMYFYYKEPFGWVCFIYAVPMTLITAGYIAPGIDRRIYKEL